MRRLRSRVDRPLLLVLFLLITTGLVIFLSASLGVLARGTVPITKIVASHVLLGIVGGSVLAFILARFPYRNLKLFAPYAYGATILFTALTLIPQLSLATKGAQRWLLLGPFTVQPAEFLKLGVILFVAYYLVAIGPKIQSWKHGLGFFLLILLPPAGILLAQPDTGTLAVIVGAALVMFFVAGARWREIFALVGMGLILLTVLAIARPYVRDRIVTFFNPGAQQHTTGYQIRQSLIAIGSGGVFGRGLGQGIQKFEYLPEPMSDSIFAVAGEELGFWGGVLILGLFLSFAMRGFWIAAHTKDRFGALLATGIVTYIIGEAVLNIGAMLGVLPLTGIPLIFISHGGTAMLIALAATGILLSISRSGNTPGGGTEYSSKA